MAGWTQILVDIQNSNETQPGWSNSRANHRHSKQVALFCPPEYLNDIDSDLITDRKTRTATISQNLRQTHGNDQENRGRKRSLRGTVSMAGILR